MKEKGTEKAKTSLISFSVGYPFTSCPSVRGDQFFSLFYHHHHYFFLLSLSYYISFIMGRGKILGIIFNPFLERRYCGGRVFRRRYSTEVTHSIAVSFDP